MALVFMGLLAGLTCSLHFVILTVSRQAAFAGLSWLPLFLSFKWPSVAYAPDILSWDVFFPLSVLSAAPVLNGSRLAIAIRALMIVSGALALGGLSVSSSATCSCGTSASSRTRVCSPWWRCCWLSFSIGRRRETLSKRIGQTEGGRDVEIFAS